MPRFQCRARPRSPPCDPLSPPRGCSRNTPVVGGFPSRQHPDPSVHCLRSSALIFPLGRRRPPSGDVIVTTRCDQSSRTPHKSARPARSARESRGNKGDVEDRHSFEEDTPTAMKISRWTLRSALSLVALLGAATGLRAQVSTGGFTGFVTDETGKAMAGAQVQAINRATGARAGTLTNDAGRYYI